MTDDEQRQGQDPFAPGYVSEGERMLAAHRRNVRPDAPVTVEFADERERDDPNSSN